MAIDTTARILTIRDAIISMINTDGQTFSGTVTGATNASPIVITTSVAHGLADGMDVTIASVGGNTAANGTYSILVLTSTTFSLVQTTGNGAYTSGGTWTCTRFTAKSSALPEYLLSQLNILQVDVRIVREETDVIDRRSSPSTEDLYYFEITVQRQSTGEGARFDALVNLGKRIAKLFIPNTDIDGLTPEVIVTENAHELYDPIMLRDYGVFYSKIELTLREYVTN